MFVQFFKYTFFFFLSTSLAVQVKIYQRVNIFSVDPNNGLDMFCQQSCDDRSSGQRIVSYKENIDLSIHRNTDTIDRLKLRKPAQKTHIKTNRREF